MHQCSERWYTDEMRNGEAETRWTLAPTGARRAAVVGRRGALAWRALRALGYGAAGLALVRLVRSVDVSGIAGVVRAAGPALALVLGPSLGQLALESASWRLFLRQLGHSVAWRPALRATLGAESVRLSLPAGAAAGDALRPVLFRRLAGVPFGDGAAVLAVRKLCHLFTQGLFLAIGAAGGYRVFASAVPALAAVGLETLVWSVAVALVLAGVAMGLVLSHGSLAARTEQVLTTLTRGRLAHVLASRRAAYAALDTRLQLLLRADGAAVGSNVATALAGWLLDAGETFILLRILSAPVTVTDAIAVESMISLVRVAAFAVPGGVGLQDLGYHELLRGMTGEPVSGAFIVLKRFRDLFWIGAGLLTRPL